MAATTGPFPEWVFSESVNAKTVANTIIVPAKTGYKFSVQQIWMACVSVSGSATKPTWSLGSNASTYNNLVGNQEALTPAVANDQVDILDGIAASPADFDVLDVGTNAIRINVSVASTYTTHQIRVFIKGFYYTDT
jgi:hypothetical protein